MTNQNKIAAAVIALAVVVLGVLIAVQTQGGPEPTDAAERKNITVRADSHRLSTAEDGKVTLVEFLYFECEACGAAVPFVEQLREQYDVRVTFVVRYLPNTSQKNA